LHHITEGAKAKRKHISIRQTDVGLRRTAGGPNSARDFLGAINMMQIPSTLNSATDIEQEILQLVAGNKDL
jgi:hypothetical protein